MPQALALAIVGIIGLPGSAATIGTAIISTAITIGLSIGASYLAQALVGTKQPKPSDGQVVVRSSVSPRARLYGRDVISGTQTFAAAVSGVFYRVLAHLQGKIDGVEKYYIDDREVTIDESGYVTEDEYVFKGRSRVRIETRDGRDDPAHYTSLGSAVAEWTSDHRGKGVCHSLTAFEQVPASRFLEMFPNRENTGFAMQVRGAIVFDPRTDSEAWSDNAALCIRDFLLHEDGFAMPAEWLDQSADAWPRAADDCDDEIDLAAGGAEPRYRISTRYTFDERPADVLARMMAACNGRFVFGDDGGLRMVVGKWQAPTFTISAGMIESYTLEGGNDGPDTVNVIHAAFKSPPHRYVEQDADPWRNESDVVLRGEKVGDVPLLAVPSHAQARRLMKQAAAAAAPEWRGTIAATLAALPVLSHRFVEVELADIGSTIVAEVQGAMRIDDGIVTGVTIDFVAIGPEAFAWDAATEEGRAPEVPPEVEIDGQIGPPTLFEANVELRTSGATTYPVAVFEWTGTLDYQQVEVQAQASGSTQWVLIGIADYGELTLESPPLVDGQTYTFRARTLSGTKNSAWITLSPVLVIADQTSPGDMSGVSVTPGMGNIAIVATAPASSNVAHVVVYRNTTGVLNRAVDMVMRLSVVSGSAVSQTIGDAATTNVVTNGDFASSSGWTLGTDWSISGGVASHANGVQSSLARSVGLAAGTVYRLGLTLSAWSAGWLLPRFQGGTTVNGTQLNFGTGGGRRVQKLTAASGNNTLQFTAQNVAVLSIDDVRLFPETPDCLPQGTNYVWIVAENGSGVEGTMSGPHAVIVD